MAAKFHELEVRSGLREKRKLSAFLDAVVTRYRKGTERTELQYIFCNDDYLLGINREYLDHNTLTDIITFDLSDNAQELTGEIYVSVERVRENATVFGITYREELHRVIFHGVLHLCGFGDKTEQQQQQMRRMEDLCLQEYFTAAM